jgi:hypothetical protein
VLGHWAFRSFAACHQHVINALSAQFLPRVTLSPASHSPFRLMVFPGRVDRRLLSGEGSTQIRDLSPHPSSASMRARSIAPCRSTVADSMAEAPREQTRSLEILPISQQPRMN